MRRHIQVLIILLAILAGGCAKEHSTAFDVTTGDESATSDPATEGSASDDGPSTPPSPSVPADDPSTTAPPTTTLAPTTTVADAPMSKARTMVLAATDASSEVSDVRIAMAVEMGGLPDFDGQAVAFGMEAAVAGDGSTGEIILDFGGLMAAMPADEIAEIGPVADMFAEPIEVRFDEQTIYMTSAFVSWLVPVTTPWVAFPADSGGSVDDMGLDLDAFSAAELLMVLRGLDASTEVVGSELVNGVETTHISGRFSAASLAQFGGDFNLSDFDPTGLGGLEADVMDVDVWIGADDVVRRLSFGVEDLSALDPTAPAGAFFRFTIDFTQIGEPITIEIPPASDVTHMDSIFG